MKKIVLVLLSMVLGVAAFAEMVEKDYYYLLRGETTVIRPYHQHEGVLISHPDICQIPDHGTPKDGDTRKDWILLHQDHPFFKEIYALLLSAELVGRPLQIGISKDSTLHEGFMKVDYVSLLE